MRMAGQSFVADSNATVTDAVILPNKVSIDYTDHDGQGHLEAISEDHFSFKGTFGYPALDPHCHVEFELYRAHHGNDVVLLGKWWNATTGTKGTWCLKLSRPAE
jgi:hypothetical protein